MPMLFAICLLDSLLLLELMVISWVDKHPSVFVRPFGWVMILLTIIAWTAFYYWS